MKMRETNPLTRDQLRLDHSEQYLRNGHQGDVRAGTPPVPALACQEGGSQPSARALVLWAVTLGCHKEEV